MYVLAEKKGHQPLRQIILTQPEKLQKSRILTELKKTHLIFDA